jgi:hypothetical protein
MVGSGVLLVGSGEVGVWVGASEGLGEGTGIGWCDGTSLGMPVGALGIGLGLCVLGARDGVAEGWCVVG